MSLLTEDIGGDGAGASRESAGECSTVSAGSMSNIVGEAGHGVGGADVSEENRSQWRQQQQRPSSQGSQSSACSSSKAGSSASASGSRQKKRGSRSGGAKLTEVSPALSATSSYGTAGVSASITSTQLVDDIQRQVNENQLLKKFENCKDKARLKYFTSPLLVQTQFRDILHKFNIDPDTYYASGLSVNVGVEDNRMSSFTNILQGVDIEQLEDTLDPNKVTKLIAYVPEEKMEHMPRDKYVDLHTLRYQSECVRQREEHNSLLKASTMNQCLLREVGSGGGYLQDVTLPKANDSCEVSVPIPNTVIRVSYYRPHCAPANDYKLLRQPVILAEYLILGTQTLAELKDVLMCEADCSKQCYPVRKGEKCPTREFFSEAPRCKDLFPSSYFYINGILYDDLRENKKVKLSEAVMKHLRDNFTPGEIECPITAGRMEVTRLNDLIVDLGLPYVYIHQGDCEHMIVFTEVRALTASDCLLLHKYPLMVKVNLRHEGSSARCYICGTGPPVHDMLLVTCHTLPGNTAQETNWTQPYCRPCMTVAFTDHDGRAITDFTIQPMVDISTATANIDKLFPQ